LLLGFVALDYLLTLALLVSGVLQLVQKDSVSLRIIHRWSAIPAIVLWALVHAAILALPNNPAAMGRLVSFVMFLMLAFAGGFSGWTAKPGARRVVHVALGSATFLLFTAFVFRFLLAGA
jgi:hypothetical protein